MFNKILIYLCSSLFCVNANLFATGTLSAINLSDIVVSQEGYNPIAGDDLVLRIDFDIQNHADFEQRAFATLSGGFLLQWPRYKRQAIKDNNLQKKIGYFVYKEQPFSNTVVIKYIPYLRRQNPDQSCISSTVPIQPNASTPVSFYIVVPANQYVESGTYIDKLTLKLYAGEASNYTSSDQYQSEVEFTITIPVNTYMLLSTHPFHQSNDLTVDLGIMNDYETASFPIYVLSNQEWSLTIFSQNNQQLVHSQYPNLPAQPYLFYVFGQLVQIGSNNIPKKRRRSAVLKNYTSPVYKPTDGVALEVPLQIQLPSIPDHLSSGTYTDTLTLSIATQ